LPSGVLRVRVYASRDPLTKRDHYLVEIVPPGPEAAAEAEKCPPGSSIKSTSNAAPVPERPSTS
jgi:hypothetical protein